MTRLGVATACPYFRRARARATSLASQLAAVTRPRVPPAVLQVCLPADQAVVENIVLVAAESVSVLNVPETTVEKANASYRVAIPVAEGGMVTLQQLKAVEAYAPARVRDARVHVVGERMRLTILVADETTPAAVTDIDVVRLRKRRWGE